jgi:CDP-diglyceride synthetase
VTVGLEVANMNHLFLESLFPDNPEATRYIKYLKNKSFYGLCVYLTVLVLVPFSWFYTTTMIAGMCVILAPAVFLLYYIHQHMKGEHKDEKTNLELCRVTYLKVALDCFALIWVGYSCSSVMTFFERPQHASGYFGFTVGFVTIPETCALIVGRSFGKTPFSYFISPKKTWEGFFGQYLGIFPSMIVVYVTAYLFNIDISFMTFQNSMIMGFAIITISILGDLSESIIKRSIVAKDSSDLFHGLGGSLDKFDSLGVTWILMPLLVKLLIHIPEGNLL